MTPTDDGRFRDANDMGEGEKMTNLDALINGEEIAEPPVDATAEPAFVVEEVPTVEETPEPQAEPKGEEAEEPVGEPPAPEPAPERQVPLTALEAERRKRQDIEGKLRELEQANAKQAPPDMYEDPEGYRRHMEKQHQDSAWETRADITEELLIESVGVEEYETAAGAFKDAAADNPSLLQKLRAAKNPAKFAFDEGKRQLALAEIQDPVAYREKVREEVTAELKGTLKAEILSELRAEQPSAQAPKPPTSLADTASTGRAQAPAWTGPDSLDDMLPT